MRFMKRLLLKLFGKLFVKRLLVVSADIRSMAISDQFPVINHQCKFNVI